MEYRQLGRSGLKVSAFGFGTMTFRGKNGVGFTEGVEARRQVDLCLEAGVNLFDTADVYGNSESEQVLAEALGDRRASVLIATKAFYRTGAGENDLGASRQHLITACEASLRRLNTDYIDLFQLHNQDLLTPPEETLRALDDLVRSGKVRYIGSSNHAGWWQMKALATSDRLGVERYVSQQIQYSLLWRDAEDELLPLGIHEGVGALVWGPLGGGYLTGKYAGGPQPVAGARLAQQEERLSALDDARARRIIEALREIAEARPGTSLSQIALNWVVRRQGVACVLLGARTTEQLVDNLVAARWSLSDAEFERLEQASVRPLRYPATHHRVHGLGRSPEPGRLPPAPATAFAAEPHAVTRPLPERA